MLSLFIIDVKYQHTIGAVCAYARVFRKRPGCELIGARTLIITNMVSFILSFEGKYPFETKL